MDDLRNQGNEAAAEFSEKANEMYNNASNEAEKVANKMGNAAENVANQAQYAADRAADKVEQTADKAAFKFGKLSDRTASADKNLAILDLAIIAFCLLNFLFFFVASGKPYYFTWFLITVLLAAKSGLAVFLVAGKNAGQIPQTFPNCVDGAFLFCGLVLVFLRPFCLFLLVIAIAIHTLIDLLHVQRSALRKVIPNIEQKAGSVMDSVSSQLGRNVERVASVLEIATLFFIPFARSGFLLFPVYIVFLALRYRTSEVTRLNFHAADAQLTTLLNNKSVSPQVRDHYKNAKEQVSKIVLK